MSIQKTTITTLSSIIFSFNSSIATAAENTSSYTSFPGWPLLLLFALILIFRKKIFVDESLNQSSTEALNTEEKQETVSFSEAPSSEKDPVDKQKIKISSPIIDISNDNQCQASTVKGTRCKRTTTLEKTSITIANKTYQLTTCSQHNNEKLKAFPELIK